MYVGTTLVCFIGMRSCMFDLTTGDGFLSDSLLGAINSVRHGMKYFNHQVPRE